VRRRLAWAAAAAVGFNVRGEPIVGSPEGAFRCFMGTGIETLAVGNCFLRKEWQNPALKQSYEAAVTVYVELSYLRQTNADALRAAARTDSRREPAESV